MMAISDDDLRTILESFISTAEGFLETATYPKGTLLHRNGEICRDLFIFHSGIGRSFYLKDGQDITSHFLVDFGIISAIDSLIDKGPSKYNIEVLETAIVSKISIEKYEHFLEINPQHERTARQLTQGLYFELAERVESLMFHSAHERYQLLMKKFPSIVNRVNLGQIATFLGISQETLSRIRKKRL